MGMFDVFMAFGSTEKKIRWHGRRLKKKDAQHEDRQASAAWLAENAAPEAILALLGRFEMTYEHRMKDAQEKDEVAELVLDLGERAVEPIRTHLRRCRNFARPLQLLQQIAGGEVALVTILEMLEIEKTKSELKPDRKRQLLIKLAEFRDPRAAVAVDFTGDFDEGVRYGAAEVLVAQSETPAIRDALLSMLDNPSEESNRLLQRIAEVAATRGWPLGEHSAGLAEHPPPGWKVAGGRLVRA